MLANRSDLKQTGKLPRESYQHCMYVQPAGIQIVCTQVILNAMEKQMKGTIPFVSKHIQEGHYCIETCGCHYGR